jgi:hypothetical protein
MAMTEVEGSREFSSSARSTGTLPDRNQASAGDRGGHPLLMRIVLLGLLLLAGALRLRHYLDGHSLYIDEAFLVLSVSARPFAEVMRSIAWDHPPHIVFLAIQRLALRLGGMNEWALRAPQLVYGIVLVGAVWWLARRLVGAAPAVLATAMVAVSPILIRYSTEARPYAGDALVAVLLVALALRVIDAPASPVRWWQLGLTGAAGILFSLSALFVLAAVAMSLLVSPQVRDSPGGIRRTLAFSGVWAAFFTLLYVLFLHRAAIDPYLSYAFSETFFDPRSPRFAQRVSIGVRELAITYFFGGDDLLPRKAVTAAVAISAVGLLTIARRRGASAALLLGGPGAIALAASAVSRYPVLPRTMLFTAPLFILMLVAGVHRAASLLPRKVVPLAFIGASLLLVIPAAVETASQTAHPRYPFDIKSAIADLERSRQPGEPVFVSYNARAGWAFYTTDWRNPDTARISWLEHSRHSRVRGESATPPAGGTPDPFAAPHRLGTEIIERLPDGVMWVETIPSVNPAYHGPFANWARTEAQRMRAYANPTVWVLYQSRMPEELPDAIRAAGGVVEVTRQYDGVRLFRVRFDRARSSG